MPQDAAAIMLGVISLIAFLVFMIIAPLWVMKRCALNSKQEISNRLLWILFMVFLWPVGQIIFVCKQRHVKLILIFFVSGIVWLSTMIYLLQANKHAILAAIM